MPVIVGCIAARTLQMTICGSIVGCGPPPSVAYGSGIDLPILDNRADCRKAETPPALFLLMPPGARVRRVEPGGGRATVRALVDTPLSCKLGVEVRQVGAAHRHRAFIIEIDILSGLKSGDSGTG